MPDFCEDRRLSAWGCTLSSAAGNVTDLSYSFDASSVNNPCSTTFASGINNGNVVAITNNITSARTQNFCYDALNRLSKAQTTDLMEFLYHGE